MCLYMYLSLLRIYCSLGFILTVQSNIKYIWCECETNFDKKRAFHSDAPRV